MPPRTRGSKPSKGLKENIGIVEKRKVISTDKITKPQRKALADKTNSASDDNASDDISKKNTKKRTETGRATKLSNDVENKVRPRRVRRLPNKYVENNILNSLSNSKEVFTSETTVNTTHTPVKGIVSVNSNTISHFKTLQKPTETILVANRPRRICRLPAKFEDHSISPNKFIPVQPVYASTPKSQKTLPIESNNKGVKDCQSPMLQNISNESVAKVPLGSESSVNKSDLNSCLAKPKTSLKKDSQVKKTSKPIITSNPANQGRALRRRKMGAIKLSPWTKEVTVQTKKSLEGSSSQSPKTPNIKNASSAKRPIQKNFSFRVLEDKKSLQDDKNPDIYEFTYDPKDEPPPQKKKKRRVVKKKPSKPKTVIFRNNYDKNLSKTLTALKNAVAKKSVGPLKQLNVQQTPTVATVPTVVKTPTTIQRPLINMNTQSVPNTAITKPISCTTIETPEVQERTKSVRIEDIAADFEISLDYEDINYSPVNSPHFNCPKTPVDQLQPPSAEHYNDPLNLRDNLSFFDDPPVASSSMMSVRHPQASPWRVEFDRLPFKWHVNSYVKSNMTPAVECSFVNFEDSKKKHVYTNMVPQSNESLPEIVEKTAPNLVQSSIISFIREVVEKNANKKQRARSKTQTAAFFNEATNTNKALNNVTAQTRQIITPKKNKTVSNDTPNLSNDNENAITSNRESSRESLKRKSESELNMVPAKTPRKDKDKYFGFDDSEVDQENVSPSKNRDSRKVRGLRPRARAVLKEINEQGPTRALLPLAPKSTNSERVNRLYKEIKSAANAPVFPEKDAMQTEPAVKTTNFDLIEDDDSQSVHLFEDIDLVHHLKVSVHRYFVRQ